MANTTIQLKFSTATGNTPSQLEFGELAINVSDGKLFYKDSSNNIDFIENFQGPSGLDGEVQFNDEGELGADAGFTYDKANSTLSIVKTRVNSAFDITGNTVTTTTTNSTVLFSFDKTIYGSGKFVVQATEGSKRQVTEILVVHDGVTAYATEYAIIRTNGNLFNLEVDINSNDVRLKTTAVSSNSTTYKVTSNLVLL
jgi:predicted transcriptional regulator